MTNGRDHRARLYELSPDVLCVIGADGHLEQANPAFQRIFGYDVGELESSSLLDLVHPDDLERTRARFDRARAGQAVVKFQVRMIRADGSPSWLEWSASRVSDDDLVYAVGRDITAEKEVEEELRSSEEMHRMTLENVSDTVLVTDDAGEFTYVCPNVDVIFGYEQKEVEELGNIEALLGEGFAELAGAGEWEERSNIETQIVDKSGSPHTVLVNLKRVAIRNGTVLTVCRDITERVELERRLQRAHRLEAIGRLAGGVAHDFNNLLTSILGFASLLEREPELDPRHRSDVGKIRRSAEQAASLTDKLLAFGRRKMVQLETVDLGELVRDLETMFRSLVPESICLRIGIAPDLPPVRVDPGEVERILLNLVLNAVDAMPGGGTLTIRCREQSFRDSRTFADVVLPPGRYVRLTVSDTGRGMDEETATRVFEPFFTTKEPDRGTGLGLASVYGSVRQHGGVIEVESRPGEGSSFEVYLPPAEDSPGEEDTDRG